MLTPEQVQEFYASRVAEHGHHPSSLDWSEHGQAVRFRAIRGHLNLTPVSSILDLGCGFGDFYRGTSVYQVSKLYPGLNPKCYTGVDQCHAMIAKAKQQKLKCAKFLCGDVFTMDLPRAWAVVSNGMLNLDTGENLYQMEQLIGIAWDRCESVCAITMLSDWSDDPKPDRYYYPADWVLDLASQFTKKVVLDHSYLEHDMMLVMYR